MYCFLQVAGGASPSSNLLASMHILTKMASGTNHPHEALACLQVKAIKNHALYMSALGDLRDLGRDASARLKKDSKYKVLKEVALGLDGFRKVTEEIKEWQEANADKLAAISAGVADVPKIEDEILAIDVVTKLQGRAPSERDIAFEDCVEHQVAEFGNQLRGVTHNLGKVTKGYHVEGPGSWKNTLDPQATLAQVIAQASGTLLAIPMENLKAEIQATEKAACRPNSQSNS